MHEGFPLARLVPWVYRGSSFIFCCCCCCESRNKAASCQYTVLRRRLVLSAWALNGPLELRHGRSELSIVGTYWQMDVVVAAAAGVGFHCAATGTDDRWIHGPCPERGSQSARACVYVRAGCASVYTPCLI